MGGSAELELSAAVGYSMLYVKIIHAAVVALA